MVVVVLAAVPTRASAATSARCRSKKTVLDETDNRRLLPGLCSLAPSQSEVRELPIEHEVVQPMQPPLNAAGNSAHPFYLTVKASRAALRAAARA